MMGRCGGLVRFKIPMCDLEFVLLIMYLLNIFVHVSRNQAVSTQKVELFVAPVVPGRYNNSVSSYPRNKQDEQINAMIITY